MPLLPTEVKPLALARGFATLAPIVRRFTNRGTGGSSSARYCYSVWLRHLVRAHNAGLFKNIQTVGEFGPGDSLGLGMAALLSGVQTYTAFDAKPHANAEHNLEVFEELVSMFSRRAPIPDATEFPWIHPQMEDYAFPRALLTDELLQDTLRPDRIAQIGKSLKEQHEGSTGIPRIKYIAPWNDRSLLDRDSIDMIFSQAVMEHLTDVPAAYSAMARLLKPGGFMSHVIDYKSHGNTYKWNGHWTVSDRCWRIVHGGRTYLINRLPHSAHLAEIERSGFRIVSGVCFYDEALPRELLAPAFSYLSDADLRTSGAFIQAVKPAL
jgi:SAM-dependent methyltransferase